MNIYIEYDWTDRQTERLRVFKALREDPSKPCLLLIRLHVTNTRKRRRRRRRRRGEVVRIFFLLRCKRETKTKSCITMLQSHKKTLKMKAENWDTIVRLLGDHCETTGRSLGDNWETSAGLLGDHWKTTRRPL